MSWFGVGKKLNSVVINYMKHFIINSKVATSHWQVQCRTYVSSTISYLIIFR